MVVECFRYATLTAPSTNDVLSQFPVSGRINNNYTLDNINSTGYHWSCSTYNEPSGNNRAYFLSFNETNILPTTNLSRACGGSVRPVHE